MSKMFQRYPSACCGVITWMYRFQERNFPSSMASNISALLLSGSAPASRSASWSEGGDAGERLALRPDASEKLGGRQVRYVVGDLELAPSPNRAGMHYPFKNNGLMVPEVACPEEVSSP